MRVSSLAVLTVLPLAALLACEGAGPTGSGSGGVASGSTPGMGSTSGSPSGGGGSGGVASGSGGLAGGGPSGGVAGAFGTGGGGSLATGGGPSSGGTGGAGAVGSGGAGSSGAGSSGAGSGGAENKPRPPVTAAPGTELVKVDAGVRHQSFEGWGTSLCWWANHVGGWAPAARDQVVETLTDPVTGLGYNIFRYNIGGGDAPAHEHMDQYREMPGFQKADGTWDWDADANQRAVLQSIAAQEASIAEQGGGLIFEAFSNSPPYWMTKSGCASGSTDGSNNLKDDAYDAFADYLTEVVLHYRDEYGITFRTLEPLNEPFANWWKSNGSQEGCHFGPSNQELILRGVAEQLTAKGLTETVVSGADENSMDDALANLGKFDAATIAVLGQINVHSYAGSRRKDLRALATRLGKRLWQSESGPLGESINDDTEAALFMAGRIIDDLRDLQAEAWVDWQSGDPSRSWATFTLNDSAQTHSPLKRFYMHAGFSRYIRPGSTLIDVDHADMVAALAPDGHSVALVVRNADQNAAHTYTFDLTTLPEVGSLVAAHRTSRSEDLAELPTINVTDYSFVATVPAYSVTTFVIPVP